MLTHLLGHASGANKTKEKREHLEQFLDDFEILKLEVRLCTDLRILSLKKQAQVAALMEGIGKQITGWRNANPKLPESVRSRPNRAMSARSSFLRYAPYASLG